MEQESGDNNDSNSIIKFSNGGNKYTFSNLSISDEQVPILIKSPRIQKRKYIMSNNNKKKKLFSIKRKKLDRYFLNKNIQNYNTSPENYNIIIINNLINLKENRLVAAFKDNLINNTEYEYLRGNFNLYDCIEVLPKFYEYYKNYLMFFCKPTFNNFYINETIQDYGEKQAEVYYKNNYVTKRQKGKKGNIDDKNIDEDDLSSNKLDSSDNNNDDETSFISYKTFFTNSVESMIKKGINLRKKKVDKDKNKDQELSDIKRQNGENKENTIYLPDNSTISLEDIITKKNSIKQIIDLMKNRNFNKIRNKKNNLSNKKENEKKKKGIIVIDKRKLIDERNIFNKKRFNSFSRTTLTLFDKNKKQKINNNIITNNNVITNSNNKKAQTNSNYLNFVGAKKQHKYIKINNIPKIKLSTNDLILSPIRNIKPRKKSANKIPSFKTNENIYNFNLTSRNQNSKNSKHKINNSNNLCKTNKINLPLKIKNFYRNIKNNINNSNSSIQLSTCKTSNNRNNNTTKIFKNRNIINKTNLDFNKNIKYIKKLKVLPFLSTKSNRNLSHNKSLSCSTLNNCNININNNIILSNNYIYHNKFMCFHNSQRQISIQNNNKSKSKEKRNKRNNTNIEPNKEKKTIPLTSRNIKINLDKFKTEENFVNSLIYHGASKKIALKNRIDKKDKSDNNIQYTSFRKASNKDLINNKQRNLVRNKKMNNNKCNKNLVLKDVLAINRSKNNLSKNEQNSISKTYKDIYIKNNNKNNNQRKLIFEYKKKYN